MSKFHPKLSQIELVYHQGKLRLRAPGLEEVVIEQEDLEHSKSKEVSANVLFCNVPTISVNDACDRLISQYVLGNMKLIFCLKSPNEA